MEILAGGATNENSIYFKSNNYIVTATLNKKENTFDLEEKKLSKNNKTINKIPIINLLYRLLTSLTIKKDNYTSINVLPCGLLLIYLIDKIFLHIYLVDYIYVLYFAFLVIYAKFLNIKEMHGAEHMTINYYFKNHHVSEQDIEKIYKENKSIFACGTTCYIIILISLFLLKLIINDFMIRFIVSYIFAHEIICISYKNKFFKRLFSPLFFISGLIQELLFISKPKEIHLKMAIAVINRLEELEGL